MPENTPVFARLAISMVQHNSSTAAGRLSTIIEPAARDGEEPAAQLATLEQIHAGLLVFCAARSDVFSTEPAGSFPRAKRTPDAQPAGEFAIARGR